MEMKIVSASVRYYPYQKSLKRRASIIPLFPDSIVFFLGTTPPSLQSDSGVSSFFEEELLLIYLLMDLGKGDSGRKACNPLQSDFQPFYCYPRDPTVQQP